MSISTIWTRSTLHASNSNLNSTMDCGVTMKSILHKNALFPCLVSVSQRIPATFSCCQLAIHSGACHEAGYFAGPFSSASKGNVIVETNQFHSVSHPVGRKHAWKVRRAALSSGLAGIGVKVWPRVRPLDCRRSCHLNKISTLVRLVIRIRPRRWRLVKTKSVHFLAISMTMTGQETRIG